MWCGSPADATIWSLLINTLRPPFAAVAAASCVYFVIWFCFVLFGFIEMSFLSAHKRFFLLLAKSNQITKYSVNVLSFCIWKDSFDLNVERKQKRWDEMRWDEIYVIFSPNSLMLLHINDDWARRRACVRARTRFAYTFVFEKLLFCVIVSSLLNGTKCSVSVLSLSLKAN